MKTSLHTLSTLPSLITMATYDVMEGGGEEANPPHSSAQKTKKSALDRANYYYDNRGARGLLLFSSIQIVLMPLVGTLRKSSADDFRIHALTLSRLFHSTGSSNNRYHLLTKESADSGYTRLSPS